MRYIQLDERTESAFREICNKSLELNQSNVQLSTLVDKALAGIKEVAPDAPK